MSIGSSFVHLHVHTEYSLLDGACRIKQAVPLAASLGMDALAISDHGVMYGVVPFCKKCKETGVKPIIGCEVYVARTSRHNKTQGTADKPYHLVLLAENATGYKNLMRVVSIGFLEGFYYRPRVDLEVLAAHSEGLIALTGCLEGELSVRLQQKDAEGASQALSRYATIFGEDNLFVEIQRNGVPGQDEIELGLVELAKRHGLPLVATNDCHYLREEDAPYHDVLLAIQTGSTVKDPDRLRFTGNQFYLRGPDEMAERFKDLPEAIENTVAIANRCNVEILEGAVHLPDYPLPLGETPESRLRSAAYSGLLARTKGRRDPAKEERLEQELSTIEEMGYSSYFLIVSDFIDYAKGRDIWVGPGRGSAAGSLVAYALGITNIDPIEHDLVFERFLNPERVTMPDIDIDFQDDRRDEVIGYVREKYGEDRVSQIITFGTMAARAAIRDVGRALGFAYGEVDRVAKLIPYQVGMTIERAIEMTPELREMTAGNEKIRELLDTALQLEGMPRHSSVHAAGIVIGKGPLWNYVPLARTHEEDVITQYPMEDLETLGLLKIDFLALRTLTVMHVAVDLIEESLGIRIEIDDIRPGDDTTYKMLSNGDAIGVFQLESSWVRDFLKELEPDRLEDIIAAVALCRPGPMRQIPEFLRARAGEDRYLHPALEPILKETHGVLVYQEQVLKVVAQVAGFTLGEADVLRRAIGSKRRDLLVECEKQFLAGARERGFPIDVARRIYGLILEFANYGFSKNHAAPYALLAYQTAYLKANYPLQFMAALLSSVAGIQGKVGLYLEEVQRLGGGVEGPSVNRSKVEFSVEDAAIRYGLGGVKNVGKVLASAIVSEREANGPFVSLEDFVNRLDSRHLTKKALESLIQCGACDVLGTRYSNLDGMERALAGRLVRVKNQALLFGEPEPATGLVGGTTHGAGVAKRLPDPERIALDVRLSWERALLGMYFSGHPLEKYKDLFKTLTTPIADIESSADDKDIIVGGRIAELKKVMTRAGEEMAFATVEDDYDSIEVIVFPTLWRELRGILGREKVVVVRGSLEEQEETRRILARDIRGADEVLETGNIGYRQHR